MDQKPITVLQQALEAKKQALEAKRGEMRVLEADIEEFQRAIRKLQASDGSGAEEPTGTPINDRTFAAIVRHQEQAIEDDNAYPAEKFKGKMRIAIALELANDFGGYVATSAFRKILAKPGVLKSANQVGSVASRVLAKSPYFERVWEGLYWLKEYQGEEGMTPSVEE